MSLTTFGTVAVAAVAAVLTAYALYGAYLNAAHRMTRRRTERNSTTNNR